MTILTVRPYKMSNSSSDTDCYFSDAETIIGSQIVHDYNHNVSDLEFSDSTDLFSRYINFRNLFRIIRYEVVRRASMSQYFDNLIWDTFL